MWALVTSQRKRKKAARSRGMNLTELELIELLEEMLESFRWQQVLGYSNQFLLNRMLDVPEDERDRILEAATRAVEKDARLHEWQDRLARIKGEALDMQRRMRRARRDMEQGRPGPEVLGERAEG